MEADTGPDIEQIANDLEGVRQCISALATHSNAFELAPECLEVLADLLAANVLKLKGHVREAHADD